MEEDDLVDLLGADQDPLNPGYFTDGTPDPDYHGPLRARPAPLRARPAPLRARPTAGVVTPTAKSLSLAMQSATALQQTVARFLMTGKIDREVADVIGRGLDLVKAAISQAAGAHPDGGPLPSMPSSGPLRRALPSRAAMLRKVL